MNLWHKQELAQPWRMSMEQDCTASGKTCTRMAEVAGALPVYPATVPGSVEIDLQAAGVLADPFYGLNILKVQELETYHFYYSTTFACPPREGCQPELLFEGLDTLCDIYVNGVYLGHADNMLIEHRFALPQGLTGENELFLHFYPVSIAARALPLSPGIYSHSPANYEALRLRKAPHMFGWDIAPRMVSAGVWRPAYVRWVPQERVEDCYVMTHEQHGEGGAAKLTVFFRTTVQSASLAQYRLRITGTCGDSAFAAQQQLRFVSGLIYIPVQNARLWWPRGRGAQSLYDVRVELWRGDTLVDTLAQRVGIRTVALERTAVTDPNHSGKFCFRINGEKVFWMGTNWVQLDALHCRDSARLEQTLALVEDIGCNSLRCWGGNVYESERFFDLCDEKGIMIWQDFALACGVYPQDEPMQKALRREAICVVQRLRNHASLVLWAGDNENDLMMSRTVGDRDPNICTLTRQLLKEVVQFEDPTRPYLPSSPFYDAQAYVLGRQYITENHLWGPRDYFKSDFYTGSMCHFVSEIGYHGCPSLPSLQRFLTPKGLWPWQDNPEWIVHAANDTAEPDALYAYRVRLMADQVGELFGSIPGDLPTFALASQISQAEAMKFFVELFRQQNSYRTGIIWWNIMDCWPQFSDAVVDYYFSKKLAYYYLKRSQQPLLLLMAEPKDWYLPLMVVNDQKRPVDFTYTVRDGETDEVLLSGAQRVEADSTRVLDRLRHSRTAKRFYRIDWAWDGQTGTNHYLSGNPGFDLDWYLALARKHGLWPADAAADAAPLGQAGAGGQTACRN